MRLPQKKRKKVLYHFSLVAYTDILGFQELISERTPGQLSEILRVFKETTDPIAVGLKRRAPTEYFVNFSDLCIISTPIRKPGTRQAGSVFFQLLLLVHAQVTLISDYNVFIRGGVTVGNVARSYRLLFGQGIIDAYKLESKVASHPRIVVSSEVLEELDDNRSLWVHDKDYDKQEVMKLLRRDDDGEWFIDYLRAVRHEFEYDSEYQPFLERHAERIAEALNKYADDPKVLKKYEWLQRYHDSHMKRLRDGELDIER